jgi:hypothetical protein
MMIGAKARGKSAKEMVDLQAVPVASTDSHMLARYLPPAAPTLRFATAR